MRDKTTALGSSHQAVFFGALGFLFSCASSALGQVKIDSRNASVATNAYILYVENSDGPNFADDNTLDGYYTLGPSATSAGPYNDEGILGDSVDISSASCSLATAINTTFGFQIELSGDSSTSTTFDRYYSATGARATNINDITFETNSVLQVEINGGTKFTGDNTNDEGSGGGALTDLTTGQTIGRLYAYLPTTPTVFATLYPGHVYDFQYIANASTGYDGGEEDWSYDYTLSAAAVPEPASLSVLAIGSIGLLVQRRRA